MMSFKVKPEKVKKKSTKANLTLDMKHSNKIKEFDSQECSIPIQEKN